MKKQFHLIYYFNRLKTRTIKRYFYAMSAAKEHGKTSNFLFTDTRKTKDGVNACLHSRFDFIQTKELAIPFESKEEAEKFALIISAYTSEKCQIETIEIDIEDIIGGKGLFSESPSKSMDGERKKIRGKAKGFSADELEELRALSTGQQKLF